MLRQAKSKDGSHPIAAIGLPAEASLETHSRMRQSGGAGEAESSGNRSRNGSRSGHGYEHVEWESVGVYEYRPDIMSQL